MSEGRVTARGVAISALVAAEEGERANLVLPRMLSVSGLDERDRGFATELAYGALRMCRACDWLVGQFAKGELEPAVRAAARAGAYQLAFMRVPAYAAVSATVAECPPRARPLLNAVLRRIADLVAGGPDQVAGPGDQAQLPRLGASPPGRGPRGRACAGRPPANEPGRVAFHPPGRLYPGRRQPGGGRVRRRAAGRPAGAGPGPLRRAGRQDHVPGPWLALRGGRRRGPGPGQAGGRQRGAPPARATSPWWWPTAPSRRSGRRALPGCWWTRHAAGWGCSGAARTPAGGRGPKTSGGWPPCKHGS